jgi:hypothetical protein
MNWDRYQDCKFSTLPFLVRPSVILLIPQWHLFDSHYRLRSLFPPSSGARLHRNGAWLPRLQHGARKKLADSKVGIGPSRWSLAQSSTWGNSRSMKKSGFNLDSGQLRPGLRSVQVGVLNVDQHLNQSVRFGVVHPCLQGKYYNITVLSRNLVSWRR